MTSICLYAVRCSPRLIRIVTSTNWSVHDLILVDCEYRIPYTSYDRCDAPTAPEFHLVIQEGSNGEVYNMAIRGAYDNQLSECVRTHVLGLVGANIGGSDGIDVWGTNHWIHDIEVTNRDECVTVKVRETSICVPAMLTDSIVASVEHPSRAQ